MHPVELEERLRDARHEGFRDAVRNEDQRIDDLKRELRNYRAILYALAIRSAPQPLRIKRIDIDAVYPPDCVLHTGMDIVTNELLIWVKPKS